jgi:hypothetical protein
MAELLSGKLTDLPGGHGHAAAQQTTPRHPSVRAESRQEQARLPGGDQKSWRKPAADWGVPDRKSLFSS